MAAAQHRRRSDRHDCTVIVRTDRAQIARVLATPSDRLATSDGADSYCKPVCKKSIAGHLRDSPRDVGIPPVCDGIRSDTNRASQGVASLLESILGKGYSEITVEALLQRFGDLPRLLLADFMELVRATGSQSEATILRAIQQTAMRLIMPDGDIALDLGSSDAAISYLLADMKKRRVETFRVLFLDTHNRLLADETMWTGSVREVQIHPREVVRRALELDSSAIILAHNHPSYSHNPSPADLETTEHIISCAASLDIIVHDHLIISRRGFHSMRIHKSIDPWG